jgi:hypothetical protein
VLDRAIHFLQCVHGQLPFGEGGFGDVCRLAAGVRSDVRIIKKAVNLGVHQDGDRPSAGIPQTLTQKLASLKSECHAITNKHPEANSVLQQV